jgi:hypothetical protein
MGFYNGKSIPDFKNPVAGECAEVRSMAFRMSTNNQLLADAEFDPS